MTTPPNRNVFTDPISGDVYLWPTNHSTEDPVVVSRQMGDGAQTSNLGLVPQQGAASPVVLKWEGTMFLDSEVAAIMQWWRKCEDQTINATDFSGSQYELIITDFEPQRVGVVGNPRCRDSANPNSTYIWKYTLTIRIIRAFNGIWKSFDPQSPS